MLEPTARGATAQLPVGRVLGTTVHSGGDSLAVEEPLELRLAFHDGTGGLTEQSVSITMRTPGDDFELACGFLVSEGLVQSRLDLDGVRHCGPVTPSGQHNVVKVTLKAGAAVDLKRLQRHFYTTSSCGVCGKTSLEALHVAGMQPLPVGGAVSAEVLHRLPAILRERQAVFAQTGGLHAAGLFTPDGTLQRLHEDVGRHNAVDKVIGAAFRAGELPLTGSILLVSGRSSFELVQKAVLAGISVMAAVGAPSSLAVDLAKRYGLTLLGFVRNERFNIYCGEERVAGLTSAQ